MTLYQLANDPQVKEQLKKLHPKTSYHLEPRFFQIVNIVHHKLLNNLVDSYLQECAPNLEAKDLVSKRLNVYTQRARDNIIRIAAKAKIPAKAIEAFFSVKRMPARLVDKE